MDESVQLEKALKQNEEYAQQIIELGNNQRTQKQEIEEYEKQENEYAEQTADLNEKIDILVLEKQNSERKITSLTSQIGEMLEEQVKIGKKINATKKQSTLIDYKPELGIYLKGMFEYFDFEHHALVIMVDAVKYYYPLYNYQCLFLPMSGSRVLIFKSERNKNLIYGFDAANIIDPANKIKAEIKSLIFNNKQVKVHTKEYGFLTLTVSEEFFTLIDFKLGDQVILNQIYIDGDYYFCIDKENKSTNSRDTILKTFLKESFD